MIRSKTRILNYALWAPLRRNSTDVYNGAAISSKRLFNYLEKNYPVKATVFSSHTHSFDTHTYTKINIRECTGDLIFDIFLIIHYCSVLHNNRDKMFCIVGISPFLVTLFPLIYAKNILGKQTILRIANEPISLSSYKFQIKKLLIAAASSKIIVLSRKCEKLYASCKFLRRKLVYLPNPVYSDNIKDLSLKKSGSSKKNILCVGRVCERKGQELLIQSLHLLHRSSRDYRMVFVGPLSTDKRYMNKIFSLVKSLNLSNHVEFVGFAEDPFPYYQSSSIFCLPSLNEGLSNSMLEALSFGLPVITTDVSGARDVIIDDYNGFIVKRNPSEIASKILTLLENSLKYESMKVNALASVEPFLIENLAPKFLSIL